MLIPFLLTVSLAAQTPADRTALAAWDDSLQRLANASALSDFQALAGNGNGPTKDIRQTLFRLRSASLRESRGDLAKGIENALLDATQHPNWPWPRLVLARTYFAMEASHTQPLQTPGVRLGESLSDAGWRELREALTLDSSFAGARTMVLTAVVPGGDRELRPDARASLNLMFRTPFPEPDLLLAWGRELRRRKLYDSALTMFNRAALAGGDAARLGIERARIQVALGDSTGATQSYWSGLDRITPIGREMYRYDLAWILSPDSLAVFDKVPDAQLRTWLHRFWAERDAAAANTAGARLLEQLRRWVFVLEHYRSFTPWRRTMFERVEMLNFDQAKPCLGSPPSAMYEGLGTQPSHPGDLRDREMLLDQRGAIYLRHGEPVSRIGFPLSGEAQSDLEEGAAIVDQLGAQELDRKVRNNESWIYFIDGQWRMLNFQGSQAYGTYAPTTLISYLPLLREAYYIRGQYMSSYAAAVADIDRFNFTRRNASPGLRANMEPLECYPRITKVVQDARADALVATVTDTDSPPLIEPWAAVIRSFALGDASEHNGRVLVTFAIAAKDVVKQPSGDGRFDYPISFRIAAYEGTTDQWVQVDTLQHLYANTALSSKSWVTGWFEIPVSSGHWQVSVLAKQTKDSAGTYSLRRGLVVDSGQALSLSDLVTGRAGAAAWEAPDGKPFPLNPTGVWPEKTSMEVYYEVRGLRENADYRSTIQLRNAETGKVLVNLKTSDRSAGALTSVRKTLGLAQVKAGKYLLVVSVESGGKSVERTTPVVVEKR